MRIDKSLLDAIDSFEADPSITITRLTRELGTTPRALRFYEEKGLLIPKRHRGRRTYGPADQARARLIVELRSIDVAVTEIETILNTLLATSREERSAALQRVVDEQIVRLQDAGARIEEMLDAARTVREQLGARTEQAVAA